MIIQKVQSFGKKLLQKERSAKRLARSISVGIFIAFSPFIGFHTLLALVLCWFFSLNYPITFSVQLAINNPWTMLPVYGCGYGFGRFVCALCSLDVDSYTPRWFIACFAPIFESLGLQADAASVFLLGGTLLGGLLALLLYPLVRYACAYHTHKTKIS